MVGGKEGFCIRTNEICYSESLTYHFLENSFMFNIVKLLIGVQTGLCCFYVAKSNLNQ